MTGQLDFISGLVTMGFAVAALFFAKFWMRTGDFFFLLFAIAFVLLATEQAALVGLGALREETTYVYLLRLMAFVVIAGAILHKNRDAERAPDARRTMAEDRGG